jgi:hypothetical protein
MKGLVLICSCSLVLWACSGKEKIPAGVLPEKKMQAVLLDIMRADQFLANFVLNRDTSLDKREESIKLYRRIFRSHTVSKEDFQQSMIYYSAHPALLKTLMDSVSALSIRRPEAQVETPVRAPSVKKDSVPGKKKLKPLPGN